MGGGGSNSSPPVDVAPGGGTYPVNAFGTAYNPEWGSGSPWLSAVGTGLKSFGKGMTSGAGSVPAAGDVPQLGAPQIYGEQPQPPVLIPQNNLLDALMRILSGG